MFVAHSYRRNHNIFEEVVRLDSPRRRSRIITQSLQFPSDYET